MGKRYISKPDKEQNVTSTAHKRTLSNVKGKKINPGANVVVATACKDGILYKQAAKPPLLYFIFYVLFQNYY